MGSGSTSTTTPGMLRAENSMDQAKATADSGVRNVQSQLAALKATWVGDASTAFDGSMQKWLEDCQYISTKLGEMKEVMVGNRQTITTGESQNTDLATSMPVGNALAF